MIEKWIYYLLFFIIIIEFEFNSGIDIYISINLDYLPVERSLTACNSSITFNNCSFLNCDKGSLIFKINKTLKSTVCSSNDNSNLNYFIFTYYTNILNAIVTLENNEKIEEFITKLREKIFLLYYGDKYINFVICSHSRTNCEARSDDHRKFLRNSTHMMYTACKNENTEQPCITIKEFTNIIKVNRNGTVIGNEIIVRKSNTTVRHRDQLNCHNGGIAQYNQNTKKTICACPETDAFIGHGPLCEALQQRLSNPNYLYVLPNSRNLIIEFSLSSPAFRKVNQIFYIKSENNIFFLEYTINEYSHIINVSNQLENITYPLDTQWTWLDIFIGVSKNIIIFKINEKEKSMTVNLRDPLKLDTFPFVLYDGEKTQDVQICISNLRINSQIVDLYTLQYNNCIEGRCANCKKDQHCLFIPFKSNYNVKCICKHGVMNETGSCTEGKSEIGHLKIDKIANLSNIQLETRFINFRFRTIIKNGILMRLAFKGVSNVILLIQIISQKLSLELKSNRLSVSTQFLSFNYFVSDGEWYSLQIRITKYLMEVKLDNGLPFNSNRTWIDKTLFSNYSVIEIEEIQFGPFNNESANDLNLSTCYDTIYIIPSNFITPPKINPITLPTSFLQGCSEGNSCTDKCKINEKCINEFQRNRCICIDNYIQINESCFKIQTNCTSNENKCETYKRINFWWIILLFLIYFLVIIYWIVFIAILCRKYLNSLKIPKTFADINKTYENLVCYNDRAGESDYSGPPIDFELLNKITEAKDMSSIDLLEKKEQLELKNKDLILDQALMYEYEGENSDLVSVSSLGSSSTDEELNVDPIQIENPKFASLKYLYK